MRGKRRRKDIILFSLNLTDNILSLHRDLVRKKYRHGPYRAFKINDPKPRDIHKAQVRDRLLHHAIYRILYPYFDRGFIFDSYSCRINKGTHRAINRFREYAWKISCNHTKTVWVLKCDIRKFFASIDHNILKKVLKRHIKDENALWLLGRVIDSFPAGLPLGNLTSQLLVNVLMNGFDQFVKRELKVKHYIRYADDFVIFSRDENRAWELVPKIKNFLENNLRLELHPQKVSVITLASGVDFLGWVHFLTHRVLRTSTKRRMLKRIKIHTTQETINSYLGTMKHGNTYKIRVKYFGADV